MFSTITSVPSMMIPKSIAPIESKLAGIPRPCRKIKENSKLSGIVSATITAARTLTRKNINTISTSAMPQQQVVLHRIDGQPHQIAAVVIRDALSRPAAGCRAFSSLGLLFHSLQHVLRLLAAEHQNDAFHRVIRLIETEFAQSRRVTDRHVPDIADAHRHAIVVADDDVANILGLDHQPSPRT